MVAINSDPSCDMVKRADFAIIGDGDAVLAAVCAQLGQPHPESGDSRHEEVRHDAA
ncbi:hypothetical protein [Salinicola tamaricis]|uniref:hypothetical protein n=1 Tax=Salinicola tamaricis TaxID=1771309 RepID=UPI001F5CFE86|nr:hypothetical protein [Salinicola tamaricis]